jgi:iron complex transport system substrate-binding protein
MALRGSAVRIRLAPYGDVVFLLHTNSDNVPGSLTVNQFANDPLFSQLQAVQQGQVYQVDAEVWHLGSNILGANRILDDLFKYLVVSHLASGD